MDTESKAQILAVMRAIAEMELDKEAPSLQQATYNDQKLLISELFKSSKEYNTGTIMLRLVVIDSLYSTNAAYSYFSFEEMADKICSIGNERSAQDYFYQVALTGNDPRKLFCEPYGIRKNLADGSMQMSLLSKYAYYALMQDSTRYPLGFPIYDRLAKEAYPTVCKMLDVKKVCSLPALETPSINDYIKCLGQLRQNLFGDSKELFHGYQQFDILDAYLWRMGKFEDGNLSLLLGWKDYERFVKNLGLEIKSKEDDTAYRKRMSEKYKNTVAVDKQGKFDFNKAMMQLLYSDGEKPFNGLSNKDYLNFLLQHWRVFHKYRIEK